MVHGSLFCDSSLFSGNISLHSLKLVLFLVQNSTGWAEPRALPGTGWYTAGAHSSGPGSHRGAQGTSLLSQLLLKSHQVCRNLLFVTLAGCTQMLKPQHRIHPIASLKLV